MCANCRKNEWIIFFSIPLIFVLQEDFCVREVQSTTGYQQLNTFTLLHLHIAKFRVQGCTSFQVITWNIKLVHSNESWKITASSFFLRKQVIIQFMWERKFFGQSFCSKNCLYFCDALFLEDLANWWYCLKQKPNSFVKAAQL